MPALPAINNLRSALSLPLSNLDTVATMSFTTGFPNTGVFSIEEEVIAYTGRTPTTFTGLIRGYDGTIAASHIAGLVCNLRIVAKHLNDAAFINPLPMPVTIGGLPAGTTFPVRESVQEVLAKLLYPYQYPAFTALAITGYASPFEVGYTVPASLTFTWATSNPSNIQPSSLDIVDVTGGNVVLASGLANDGSEAVVLGASIQKIVAATHQFRMDGMNTIPSTFSGLLNLFWLWKLHYGNDANPTLTGVQIAALSSGLLTDSYARSYATAAGGYKYICQADAAGGQLNTVKDQLTGFNVPMATVADDAAYSHVDGGGFSYALVSFTNGEGIVTNYRCYRTKNSLGGAVTLVVT